MIGSMRHRVEIQSAAGTNDGMGGRSRAWNTSAEVWARITEKTGKEQLSRGKLTDSYSHIMVCRHTTSLTTNSRVKYGDRYFNVISVVNMDGRDRYMEAVLEEGTAI